MLETIHSLCHIECRFPEVGLHFLFWECCYFVNKIKWKQGLIKLTHGLPGNSVRFRERWRMRPKEGRLCFKPLQTLVSLDQVLNGELIYVLVVLCHGLCVLIKQTNKAAPKASGNYFPPPSAFWPISYGGTQFLLLQSLRLKCQTWWQLKGFWHSQVMKSSYSWCWNKDNKDIQPYFSEKRAFSPCPRDRKEMH